MTRKIIAPLLAAALAFSPIAAAPARADGDLAKVLLGATALFIIADGLDKNGNRTVRRVAPVHRDWFDGNDARGRNARVIPSNCVRVVNTRVGRRQIATERCMTSQGVRRLPDRCEVSLRGGRPGAREAYGVRCLAQYGYRVEARRR
ncbi:MAG: hypothetical protein JXJ18_12110 [Rhodobacteraceae bacterium]|nr:hypothetical protein [Paracoccaceae bacterium]